MVLLLTCMPGRYCCCQQRQDIAGMDGFRHLPRGEDASGSRYAIYRCDSPVDFLVLALHLYIIMTQERKSVAVTGDERREKLDAVARAASKASRAAPRPMKKMFRVMRTAAYGSADIRID